MTCRFLYNNLITAASMITVSSLRNGIVSSALKSGTGSAVITTSGNFTGTEDLEYTVEIDSIAAGAEVGQATFKWSDGGGGWDASGVTTPSVATELNNGVKIAFTTGSGADFVVGDKWYFKAINLFNGGKMIEWNRDTRYRSAALSSPNTIIIDLGSAQAIKALILFDHNFTSAATITLEGNSANAWGSPAFSEAVTWTTDKILHYLSATKTYQYWRISITDAANTDLYIEVGEIFLGAYLEPAANFSYGHGRDTSLLFQQESNKYGVKKSLYFNKQKSIKLPFKMITLADADNLETMVEALGDRDTGIMKPLYFNEDSSDTTDLWLMELVKMTRTKRPTVYYDVDLELTEVVKSV